jgi:predicted amidophosphoribosyltransferase
MEPLITTRAVRGVTGLFELVWPVECAGCGAPGVALCVRCTAAFAGPAVPVRLTAWPGAPPTRAAAGYRGRARATLVRWKDQGRYDVTGVLAGALTLAVAAVLGDLPAGTGPPVLVPVPSRWRSRRRRGEDLVATLAAGAAHRLTVTGDRGRIRAVRVVAVRAVHADQAGLGATERMRNVSGGFGMRRWAGGSVAGRDCLVVDDVLTTGASVAETARVVTEAGGRVVGVAATCATPARQSAVRGSAALAWSQGRSRR